MHAETKKLGEMLVEAQLITPAQLQEALRHQRIAGGRMGSNLVAMGSISEDLLMDFLAQQTGVPRMDVKNLDIPMSLLERIPRRLAEQLVILPVGFKEPKSLVLAMADPSDLNAVDSARFASGLNIEPVVASHSNLKAAIAEHYRLLETGTLPMLVDGGGGRTAAPESLAVPFELPVPTFDSKGTMVPNPQPVRDYPKDPFFGSQRPPQPEAPPSPFSFFSDTATPPARESQIIHARSAKAEQIQPLENFGTRALILGLIKMLQRRGILGEDELQRFLANMIESREIDGKL
jgi:hypothetical protein